MIWAAIIAAIKSGDLLGAIKAIGEALAGLFRWLDAKRAEELGRLKEAERNAESDRAVRDAVLRADPDGVSDEQAFGAGGSDNDLPRSKP